MTLVNDAGLRPDENSIDKIKREDRHEKDSALMASRWHLIDEHEVVSLIADHHRERCLCAALERIADDLPDLPSAVETLDIEQQLAAYAGRHMPVATALFQRLSDDVACPSADRILKEIRHNHAIDAIHADDLSIELRRLSGSLRADHPGELAYMLRCFFDGCRRAVAFEEVALLILAGERLTPAAKKAIVSSFAAG